MKIKILIIILLTTFLGATLLEAKPRVRIVGLDNGFTPYYGSLTDNIDAVTPNTDTLDANNIAAQIWNKGIFDQDINTNNFPGFEWPKGTGKYAIFTAGLTIAGKVEGDLRMVAASYSGEWAPGYVENGVPITDARFKLYSVKVGDNANNNPDYANWGDMVPFGAPYVDINNNGTYDPGTDLPGVRDASETIFVCLTDGFVDEHNSSEGFGGGTAPMNAEMHLTAWAYNVSGIEDMQFLSFKIINKNTSAWDSTFFGIVVDPDLGDATDDWIGCDPALNMAYCFNSSNTDGTGTGITYGSNPPASGMDFFRSPINSVTGDTLGLTSFVYFTNPGSGQAVCEQDPDSPEQSYRYLQGLKSDGTSWLNPAFSPPRKTVFCYPGDPEANTTSDTNWAEADGRINNCGGDTTGTVDPSPGGDRRFIFNSGSFQFTMNPGDTQEVVLAQFVARGSNNLNSVTLLKRMDETAQKLFDADFNVIPPPPTPISTVSYEQLNENGEVAINFAWQNNAESYQFLDTVFAGPQDSSIYKFQGYQIYEIRKSANSLPNFYDPASINDDLTLLAIFDIQDTVGIIQDSISMGFNVNNQLQYGYFPVVPPYTYSQPSGFPNSGLMRNFRVTQTNYPGEYNGNAALIYGQEYKYLIIAYGYSPNAPRGLKANFSPLSSSVITVRPTATLAGTQTYYNTGDTLNTNRRDLGLAPIILDANALTNASYRVQYNADTTYNILKSVDGGAFGPLAQNIALNNSVGSYNFDGIQFKVNRITRTGVIRDSIQNPASNQSRQYGFSYNPPGNKYLEGSKYVRQADRPWQSQLMNLSWPTQTTFTGLGSLVSSTELRNVEIEFTGLGGAGQMAYRYLDTSTVGQDNWYLYQDFVEVPFRAYEVDPTDSTAQRRQINVAFVVSNDINPAPAGWEPSADSLGGKLITYFFRSDYNPNPDPFYTSKNLFLQQGQTDIMYVWAPKLIAPGATYSVGDVFSIYPYYTTRPNVTPGYPLYYDFNIQGTTVSTEVAVTRGDMEKIRAVPNPYLGFNVLESSSANRFITFRRLPEVCTIKIYTLNGDLVRKIEKNNTVSDQQWNLRTFEDVPVASGMYIALIDAPGIGQKIIKLAIFTGQERADF